MFRPSPAILAVLSVGVLAGCASGSAPEPDPGPPDPGASPEQEVPCIVGLWELDVPDYAAQSEAFVLGLGIPITGFAMSGAGSIQFTADGLVATDIDLTVTGTIVAGDAMVPVNTRSAYAGSGDWSSAAGSDTIDLENWANLPAPDVPVDPSAPSLPTIDYSDVPAVTAECSADTLVLQAPGAPLYALWHR